MRLRLLAAAALVALFATLTSPARAIALGQVDTFSASVESWFAGGGPVGGVPPSPPIVIAGGGPAGAADPFLRVIANGAGGPGGRLVAMNAAQWAGDYLSAGVAGIAMDLRNLGTTDLTLRLLFEDPMGGAPTNVAATSFGVTLFAGGDWTHVIFPIAPPDLTVLQGDASSLLSNVTLLRLYHSPTAVFPGEQIVAQLGVDNIATVVVGAVSEPAAATLLLAGIGLLGAHRRKGRSRQLRLDGDFVSGGFRG